MADGVETMNEIITYIIKTDEGEYYCGATINLIGRLEQHQTEKIPHWFGFKNRKKFQLQCFFNGDYEERIKKFGVKAFIDCLNHMSNDCIIQTNAHLLYRLDKIERRSQPHG
jgi:predicted GIY-YIG superfamily endonuclease